MGMLVEGKWSDTADQTMKGGRFVRKPSPMRQRLDVPGDAEILAEEGRLVYVASKSCPWSHAATIVHALNDLEAKIPLQIACGPRIEGYQIAREGPLADDCQHLHELYSATTPDYTGRATIPLLWDRNDRQIVANDSTVILRFFDRLGSYTALRPAEKIEEINMLLKDIYHGLSNAVYRAGMAQRQDEYDTAVELVFRTMQNLEERLRFRQFLVTSHLTEPDVRLFATLVRFDTVYATHFRCTRHRLVDFPNLSRFTKDIYQNPSVRRTVDFEEIRRGYYLNDGTHNPYGIVAEQPFLGWQD